jgi:hypothetical protein
MKAPSPRRSVWLWLLLVLGVLGACHGMIAYGMAASLAGADAPGSPSRSGAAITSLALIAVSAVLAIVAGAALLRGSSRRGGADAVRNPGADSMDHVPQVTRADVLRVVRRDFRPEDREPVLALLDQGDVEPGHHGAARTHLAVLKLSAGSVDRVRELVSLARSDFRDVVAPAEYPEFMKIGFVGMDRLAPEEMRQLREWDWRQYHEWLTRE